MKKFLRMGIVFSALYVCIVNQVLANNIDTVRVMAYNVLNYGIYCQGPNDDYHNYLKTIVQYTNPDIISLEKMGSIPMYQGDIHGKLPIGFGDSILQFALNAAYPGRFEYCPFSNLAGADNMSMLFYNQAKFGFVSVTFKYANITDFDCYKLYYKDPNMSITHDTTFLYVIPNHDISGNSSVTDRGLQIAGYIDDVKTHFSHLPNMVTMGDFNLRYTSEPLYQTLTAPTDTNYRFFDPPFYPDNHLTYPANWDADPTTYTAYLTTSTRALSAIPNSCGTSGGAKSWYDHIFVSPWIANNANYIQYSPDSYRTIGNDGHRLSISANDNSSTTNTSAPANVIEAVYQMSNKYPIMIDLLVTPNTAGTSPVDPEISNVSVANTTLNGNHATVVNPISSQMAIAFTDGLAGEMVSIQCTDIVGRFKFNKTIKITKPIEQVPADLAPGIYYLTIGYNKGIITRTVITKQ